MHLLDYKKTSLLLTSPSKYTMILKNTLSQIVLTLPIIGVYRPSLPLDNRCWWHLLITPVQNIPFHLRPTRLSTPMIIKYKYGQLYTYSYMLAPLILEG